MSANMTAKQFIEKLNSLGSEEDGYKDVSMGQVFGLAKECMDMPPEEVEKLLESPIHKVRAGAVSIMDWQARNKKTPEERRKKLFDLYIRRHDRINDWDLVDRSAPYVVGGYLYDKPRDVLYELARSKSPWERRTAITATYYFIRLGDLDDTFKIAEILVHDPHDLVQKAVGGWVREAGKKDLQKLINFLDTYAATMPRTMLRYAIEHLEKGQREHYLKLKDINLKPK